MDQWATRPRMRLREEINEVLQREEEERQREAAAARKRNKERGEGSGSGRGKPSTPSRGGQGRGKEGITSPRFGKGSKFMSGKDSFVDEFASHAPSALPRVSFTSFHC